MKNVKVVKLERKLKVIAQQIKDAELLALKWSDLDRETMRKYDEEVAVLNMEYLDIDEQIQNAKVA